jgi:hypothetical protein
MSYNERELYSLIKKANPFFEPEESSLKPVILAMNQPRGAQVLNMRNAIARMPDNKRMKYREALAYLELEYADAALGVPQPPTPPGLRLERKVMWKEHWLGKDTYMVHCTGATPDKVMGAGLNPQRSNEWCIPSEPNARLWKWNRFAFLFLLDESDFPPKKAEQFGFGHDGYIYVAKVPALTPFMNQGGTVEVRKETAFPGVIPSTCVLGIFQYATGASPTGKKKTDYTLMQLARTAPFGVIATSHGSNTVGSDDSAGTEAKRLLGI